LQSKQPVFAFVVSLGGAACGRQSAATDCVDIVHRAYLHVLHRFAIFIQDAACNHCAGKHDQIQGLRLSRFQCHQQALSRVSAFHHHAHM
jgi:hypothetical protein